ncbi:uncharacterized protein (DUF983 family) [Pedobacter sp. CG_S7]|uniref:DUF983 domain-containing protein n=1 Tax=Pedobacter sp. CG_S7 TaxID=3143930 RepID=UPI0033985D6D
MESSINSTKIVHIPQWHAFTHSKCPRCRIGKVFTGPTYSFSVQKMNEYCPHCKLRFEREPGYFYVAMFVSYAMNVAELISAGVASYVFGLKLDYENLWYFVGVLLATILIFAPFNYRYSRLILLYWLSPGLNYQPEKGVSKK